MTETAAITCSHVSREERKIQVVGGRSVGVWQLVCGEYDHPADCSDFEVVGLEHLTAKQPSLMSLGDLKRGWLAEWTSDVWELSAHDD